jgi:hypothetical protein
MTGGACLRTPAAVSFDNLEATIGCGGRGLNGRARLRFVRLDANAGPGRHGGVRADAGRIAQLIIRKQIAVQNKVPRFPVSLADDGELRQRARKTLTGSHAAYADALLKCAAPLSKVLRRIGAHMQRELGCLKEKCVRSLIATQGGGADAAVGGNDNGFVQRAVQILSVTQNIVAPQFKMTVRPPREPPVFAYRVLLQATREDRSRLLEA